MNKDSCSEPLTPEGLKLYIDYCCINKNKMLRVVEIFILVSFL